MLHVAVVEDNDRDAEYLLSHLKRYGRENNMEIEAKRYVNGILFLEQYRGDFDLVFMDQGDLIHHVKIGHQFF